MLQWTTNRLLRSRGRQSRTTTRSRGGRYVKLLIVALLPLALVALQGIVMGSDSNLPAATEVTNQSQGELMKQAASTSSATQSSVSIQDQGTTNTTTHSGQSVSVESKSTSDASETSVRVNGRRLHVDKSGELHKTITGEDGSTTQIDVSSDNDTIGSDNSTSLSVQINNETTNTP